MLCSLCHDFGAIDWESVRTNDAVLQHHLSYASLRDSADNGCSLCELFKNGLLHWKARSNEDDLRLGKFGDALSSIEDYFLEKDYASNNSFSIRPYYWGCSAQQEPLIDGFFYSRSTNETSGPFFQLRTQQRNRFPSITNKVKGFRHNLDLAASWLRGCQSHHKECHGDNSGIYPTRLLRLVKKGTETQLVLVETAHTLGPYITLSHCWGSKEQHPLKTTRENYSRNINGINYSELPRSFQDAVLITRSLGVEYLWIDSLCIIQNSTEDWQLECSRMSSVYANSLLTIAAADAANSTVGFLSDYSPPPYAPIEFPAFIVEYPIPDHEAICFSWNTTLSNRAWVMQERLLSPRVLSFRNDRLVWECNHYTCSDDQHYPIAVNRMDFDEPQKRLMGNLDGLKFLEYWYDVVMTYSRCELTNNSDKLPALSGLANKASEKFKKPYLAGIWQEDFQVGLSWYSSCECGRISSSSSNPQAGEGVIVNIPSWSWAKSACTFHFRTEIRSQSWDMQLVRAEITLAGCDPFGEVTAGTLTVSARLRIGFIGIFPKEQWNEHCLFDSQIDRVKRASFAWDCEQASRFHSMSLDDRVEVSALLIAYDPTAFTKWIALALEATIDSDGRDIYRRVGLLLCHSDFDKKSGEYQAVASNWFDECEMQTVDIV